MCIPCHEVSGGCGAKITIEFAEALYSDTDKGIRSDIKNKEFRGIGDEYIADGSTLILTPLWWLSGRYIRIAVRTKNEPLAIQSFAIKETHYPIVYDKIDKEQLSASKKNNAAHT